MAFAEEVARHLADWFAVLPQWLVVVLVAMMPVAELRGSIPLGVLSYRMDWRFVYVLSVVANALVVPVIWSFLPPLERLLRRLGWMDRFLTWLFDRTRRRTRKRVETYEEMALFALVALPLPGTGAWTGSLVAYLFDLPRVKSFWVIAAGVATAGVLVTIIVVGVEAVLRLP